MKKITRSVIKLSEIPEELAMSNEFIVRHIENNIIHTYAEFHIDGDEHDALTLWLLDKYPTLKRKISFLIHIDI
jgi:hypothetical protein